MGVTLTSEKSELSDRENVQQRKRRVRRESRIPEAEQMRSLRKV